VPLTILPVSSPLVVCSSTPFPLREKVARTRQQAARVIVRGMVDMPSMGPRR